MALDLQQKVFRIPSDVTVSVGLRWDFVGADPIDLDLSAVSFTKEGKLLDCVFFNHPFPIDTDDSAFGFGHPVDPQHLPYMFVGGDSRIGGEEENQLPGLALAEKRREYQLRGGQLKRMGVMENIFSRLYGEEELHVVEEALDERHGGEIFDEEGRPMQQSQRRKFCDELVTFVMHKIPIDADVIFICVTSYTGADFTTIPSAKCHVINETTDECVGMIDIKRATGNGTANLVCMICRLQSVSNDQQLWNLRELNIRSFGYTFVDLLPVMLDVLSVGRYSRDDAVQFLPDYPLTKETERYYATQPLSHVRFGVGWSGEHDLDAFMVMFDAQNQYVDHLHPKHAKRLATYPHAACHSGDSINGFGTAGDDEFIDLITYRLPPEVCTIVFGVHYVESFGQEQRGTRSILDVPHLYARLQNRTMDRPKSFEVDRWNVHSENSKAAGNAQAPSYKGPDGRTQHVRTLVLGAMLRQGTVSLAALTHCGQFDEQQIRREDMADNASACSGDEQVSLFEYFPLHEHIPAGAADGFAAVVPFLRCVAQYRRGPMPHRQPRQRLLNTTDNEVFSQDPVMFPAVNPTLWAQLKETGTMLEYYAIQVQFLEVRNLRPMLPRQFLCHGEAWVCDGGNIPNKPLGLNDTPTYRTPFLNHHENTQWDEANKATKALFFVRMFDRIRVVIYEHVAIGIADLDLMDLDGLWAPECLPVPEHMGIGFNVVEVWVPLSGGELCDGEVRLRMWRLPTHKVLPTREKLIKKIQQKRNKHQKVDVEKWEKRSRRAYSMPCTLM